MHKEEIDNIQKHWEESLKYHRSLPEFPMLERRHRRIHTFMTHFATFLVGMLVVLITWAIYLVRSGL